MRQKLCSIERGVTFRGAIAGFLSGSATAASVYLAEINHHKIAAKFEWSDAFAFFLISIVLTLIVTLIEILFLYVDGVKACATMSRLAQNNIFMKTENINALNLTLVQAGLDIPNSTTPLYGIDPLVNRSPLRMLIFSFFYKTKVSASNAILKFAIKRFFPKLAGRAFGRSLIEIISAPVFAVWNFFLCRHIMKQARIRTLGPLLTDAIVDAFWTRGISHATEEEIIFVFAALKETVILCGYFHFNHILLVQKISPLVDTTKANNRSLHEILKTIPEEKQSHYLNLIALLLVIDGKRSKSKKAFLVALHQKLGFECCMPDFYRFEQMVCEGEPVIL